MKEKVKVWIMNIWEVCWLWDQKGVMILGGIVKDLVVVIFLCNELVCLFVIGVYCLFVQCVLFSIFYEGLKVDFDMASCLESCYFMSLLCSKEIKNMIKVFWLDQNFIKNGGNWLKGFGKF